MAEQYSIIAEQDNCTVVAHYESVRRNGSSYQSEAELENWLIRQLQGQGYEHPCIRNEGELMENLRLQLGKANDTEYSDAEWAELQKEIVGGALTMEDKAELIQKDNTAIEIMRDNGVKANVHLLHKDNVHRNRLQVINQYEAEGGSHANRYDVTILVNGFPLVHIELKRRGVSIKEAFNQINRYTRESFWAGKGMFDYIQLFVISNGTETKYYSNTTRYARDEEARKQKGKKKIQSNSFEFTSYWSDAENNLICDLEDFAKTFLTQRTLLNILTKYCVFNVEKELLVMRPYQIAATERILLRIKTALNHRWQGSKKAGGYIWHTTGSGKTLTSFKTAQLASKLDSIYKVVFVVDRQDLDYQTMKEYDRFCPNCANGNTNSGILLQQLQKSSHAKIIITTIQKISSLLRKNKIEKEVLGENYVFIFDECHRSQFGEMQKLIKRHFKKYIMFGFTGTPIFGVNASNVKGKAMTTADIFGGEIDDKGNHTRPLHTYTIINAINDHNVLRFKVEYHAQMATVEGKKVENTYYLDSQRIETNVRYLLSHFDIKTKRTKLWKAKVLTNVEEAVRNFKRAKEKHVEETWEQRGTTGFNSILACDSVAMAIAYYKELKRQMAQPGAEQLRIATIFTTQANEAENENGTIEENPEDVDGLDATSKEFLDTCIEQYNQTFGTSYDTSKEKFQNYYKDLSLRTKNKEIDLLIVVGMFLTGFDAKCLNTLWVDKNLKMQGLLQAYSRTNRILNALKDCGNIVCFRNLEEATNRSFGLFGDANANSIILIRTFEEYYNGYDEDGQHYEGYRELAERLLEEFPLSKLSPSIALARKVAFVRLYGLFVKATNLLVSFDQFNPENLEERNEVRIISEGDLQDYQSWYLNFRDDIIHGDHDGGGNGNGGEGDTEGLEFEMELINQVDIDIPYILALVKKYHDSNCEDTALIMRITRSVTSSPRLREKKDLIDGFISTIKPGDEVDVYEEWQQYIGQKKEEELNKIIADENLREENARKFIGQALHDGYVEESGMAITSVLPPMPIFGAGNKREEKKKTVIEKFKRFVERFLNL